MSYNELKHLAISKWGKSKIRPQDLYPGLLDSRIQLNTFRNPFAVNHPFEKTVKDWSFTNDMMNVTTVETTNANVFINTVEKLGEAAREISKENELAICGQTTNHHSYLGMLCVLQISTSHKIYIIDTLCLHNVIGNTLSSIFKNPKILKVVYSGSLLPKLQRDFKIFCVGVVLAEEVFQFIVPGQNSFPQMITKLCNQSLEPIFFHADWTIRPIPDDLMNMAAKESTYLLKSWNIMKGTVREQILSSELEKSRAATLEVYQFPVGATSRKIFGSLMSTLSPSLRKIFETESQCNLFSKLYKWRNESSKRRDVPMNQFVSIEELGLLTRASPLTIPSVKILVKSSTGWTQQEFVALLQITTSSRLNWATIPVIVRRRVEIQQELIQINSGDQLETGRPRIPPQIGNLNPTQRLKENRRLRNVVRKLKGLPIIKIKKSRGLKDKERSKMRALLHRLKNQGF